MPAIQHGLTGHGMEAGALHGGAAVLGQDIQRAEADIMPGIAVLAAGVAQPADDKFHRTMDRDRCRSRLFFLKKSHIASLGEKRQERTVLSCQSIP